MNERNHVEFILSPITENMQNAVSSLNFFGNGIELYPNAKYVIKSLFLEMTGFLEQKCKCICWEIATDDYNFRYKWLKDADGEYSDYKSKNEVYKVLMEHIGDFFSFSADSKKKILQQAKNDVTEIFDGSVFSYLYERDFNDLKNRNSQAEFGQLCSTNNALFQTVFMDEYNFLWQHRNRCAHNTTSYQKNLPNFHSLYEGRFDMNYFTWFYLLDLIDIVYIKLFESYLTHREQLCC